MITVDTHIIIWDALKPSLISRKAKEAIQTAKLKSGIIMCEISLWEIVMLVRKKRIEINISYIEFINLVLSSNNYILKGITPEIAELSTLLSTEISQDPADRIICATALTMKMPLVTADKNLRKSKLINTIW